MYHHQPPKRVASREGNKRDAWNDFKIDWETYVKSGAIGKKKPEERKYTLLSLAGTECTKYLKLVDPEGKLMTDDEILGVLDGYFLPKGNVILERYKLMTTCQKDGETISEYIYRVTEMAKRCECPISEDQLIRDKIVSGLRDNGLRENLLSTENLSMTQAINKCRATEAAKLQSLEMKSCVKEEENVNVDFAQKRSYKNWRNNKDRARNAYPNQECRSCGFEEHHPKECPAYHRFCSKCGEKGHFSRCCTQQVYYTNCEDKTDDREVNQESCSDDNWDNIQCGTLQLKIDSLENVNETSSSNLMLEKLFINESSPGTKCSSALNSDESDNEKRQSDGKPICHKAGRKHGKRKNKRKVKRTAWENLSKSIENEKVEYKCMEKADSANTNFSVSIPSSEDREELLYRNFSGVIDMTKEVVVKEYGQLFEGTGCIPDKHRIVMKETVVPKCAAPRPIPEAMNGKVKKALKDLEMKDIIEPAKKRCKDDEEKKVCRRNGIKKH